MGKKRSWFSLVKRLFVSDPKPKGAKKSRRWRWVFGGLKPKQYPALAAPQRVIHDAREEQRKNAVAVAIATAAAAEAAVAAARAAAEVVQLTGVPQSYREYEKRTRNSAAIKIQAAYRAHLARKALKALRGLVKLQAMVRGRIVRRQVIAKLKCLPTSVKMKPQFLQERDSSIDESGKNGRRKQFLSLKEELEERKTKLRSNSHKSCDYSALAKEEIQALWLQKQEAIGKRERMKTYSASLRERRSDQKMETVPIPNNENGRWGNQFEPKTEPNSCRRREMLRLRTGSKHDSGEELSFQFTLPRRSFCQAKQKPIGDESSLPNSPVFPTYMAATESAKAKARSMSTPRQRLGLFDTYDDYSSAYKLRLSSSSSFNGEFAGTNGRRGATDRLCLSTKSLLRD
ncbi:protein IQ-DOMAIN 12 [Diospyros lotus]|uniref:protein IQ-DOMAIN 12 n=1 Tax=Diospyros lotus TaxID=55363 RepID=UPI0022539AAD|nr:protein IQ-DOMAIN 12 [Diospyros lotus]